MRLVGSDLRKDLLQCRVKTALHAGAKSDASQWYPEIGMARGYHGELSIAARATKRAVNRYSKIFLSDT